VCLFVLLVCLNLLADLFRDDDDVFATAAFALQLLPLALLPNWFQ